MKQLLILTLAVFGLISCNKDDIPEPSPVAAGKQMWEMVSKQNRLVLDPFNVAFRLNTYLEEKKNPENTPERLDSIKNVLFGTVSKNTVLTENGTQWKIEYKGNYILLSPDNDLLDSRRTGVFNIETGGKTLSEEGASWTVTVPGLGYTSYTLVYGRESRVKYINWALYRITRSEGNEWDVEVNRFTSNYYENERANWTMTYRISQDVGDQSLNSIKNAVFSVSGSNEPIKVRTMYSSIEFMITFYSPIRYKASCGYLCKTSGGEILLEPYEKSESILPMEGYDTRIKWLPGEPGKECSVVTSLTFDGKSEQVNYDMYPEPIFQ